MARKIAVICISLLVLVTSGISVYHTYRVKEAMSDMITEAKISAETGEKEKAAKLAEQAAAYWKKAEKALIIFTHHTEVDTLTDVIAKLPALIEHDDLSEFCSELDQALNIMEHIWMTQLPVIQNVL